MEPLGSNNNQNNALSELLAVANKENQMLRELLDEARKRADTAEKALLTLSNYIHPAMQQQNRPSFIQRVIVPIVKAIKIPRRKNKVNPDQ